MPYSNPAIGGTELIRDAIHSRGYVAGVSGWSINRDGSAEFNGVTIRGVVVVGVDPAGVVTIDDVLPPELVAWYGPDVSSAWIKFDPGAGASQYFYTIAHKNTASGFTALASGLVDPGGNVRQGWLEAWFPATSVHQIVIGDADAGTDARVIFQADFVDFKGDAQFEGAIISASGSDIEISGGGDIVSYGNSLGRGTIYQEFVTSAMSSGSTSGTEYLVYFTGNITFDTGRAYRFRIGNGHINSTAAQNPAMRLRKNNLAGTVLVAGSRWPIVAASQDMPFTPDWIFVNTSGAPVTCALALTMQPNAAAAVVFNQNTGANGAQVYVDDIGEASAVTSSTKFQGVSV